MRLEPETRRVVVGTQEDLARSELTASAANWLVQPPQTAIDCQVKIRYRSRGGEARVEPLPGGRFHVRFREPCYGVAPGQAAVCYQGDRVLGGGWIENPLECGDLSPLSAGTDATRRLESGDKSPHSKGLAPPFSA